MTEKIATDAEIAENKGRHQCDEVAHNSFACHYQDSLLARIARESEVRREALDALTDAMQYHQRKCAKDQPHDHALLRKLQAIIARAEALRKDVER